MRVTHVIDGELFRFRLFTAQECRDVLKKIDAERERNSCAPNSMNKYGVHLGGSLRPFLADLSKRVQEFVPHMKLFVNPIAFAIDYTIETQKSLARHVDESDVTLNVCLGKRFEGGSLVFYPSSDRKMEVEQKPGYALVHLGCLAHRATPITSGSRTNLVLWCRARKPRA